MSAYIGLTTNPEQRFQAFLDWTLELRTAFEMSHTLAALGVEESRFDDLASAVEKDPTALANPVRLDVAGFRALFEKAFLERYLIRLNRIGALYCLF